MHKKRKKIPNFFHNHTPAQYFRDNRIKLIQKSKEYSKAFPKKKNWCNNIDKIKIH